MSTKAKEAQPRLVVAIMTGFIHSGRYTYTATPGTIPFWKNQPFFDLIGKISKLKFDEAGFLACGYAPQAVHRDPRDPPGEE